jgi:WD40 repeat protein
MSLRSLLVGLALVAGAIAAKAAEKSRTDLYGDPLPDGAVLRLGSARLKSDATQMFFTPDGRTLITCEGRTIRRWNAEDGSRISASFMPRPCWGPMALSPNGTRYAAGDGEGGVAVWDVFSGRQICDLPTGNCSFADFSPDGLTLATRQFGESIRLWDAHSGKERPSDDAKYNVFELVFSPDGSRLVASIDAGLVCRDATANKEVWREWH